MCDADGAVRGVDALPPGAAGAKDIDPQILGVDLDVDFLGFWKYGDRLIRMINNTAEEHGIACSLKVFGLGCLPYYQTFNKDGKWDPLLNKLFQQEMVRYGVVIRNIAICYRHSDHELELTKEALSNALEIYKKGYEEGASKYLIM